MKMMHKRNKIATDEKGFASIVIALILIIVLALLTVAFAQLARREQADALDKQLAVQANYAAETGINDAYTYIEDNGTLPANNAAATQCNALSQDSSYPYQENNQYEINK